MLLWKEEYSIGVPLIDEQHKELFRIGNKAYELLKNDLYIDKYDKIINIISELKDYTAYHFKAEEKYMLSISYKKYFTQKVNHDEFIKKINAIKLEHIDKDQDKYIKELLEFVFDWIITHILKEDKLIGAASEQ